MGSQRIYFTSASTTSTTARGSWTLGSSTARVGATSIAANSGASGGVGFSANQALNYRHRTIVSPTFTQAGSISGTVNGAVWAYANSAVGSLIKLHIYVMTGSGTVRGTLLSNSAVNLAVISPKLITGIESASLTSVAGQIGDRIVIELGWLNTSTTSPAWSGFVGEGGPADAVAESTSTGQGWLEFSEVNDVFGGGSTPLSSTDSGSMSGESAVLFVNTQHSRTDSGSLADASALTGQGAPTGTDSGQVIDVSSASSATSTGDSGLISDSSVLVIVTALSATDTATLAEVSSIARTGSTADSGTLAEVSVLARTSTSTDTASLAENSSVFSGASLASSDSGALAETASIVVTGAATDSGALTDLGALVSGTNPSVADTAAMAEAASLSILTSLARTDSGTVADTAVLFGSSAQVVADLASLAEVASGVVRLVAYDGAQLAEAAGIPRTGLSLSAGTPTQHGGPQAGAPIQHRGPQAGVISTLRGPRAGVGVAG